MIKVRKTLHFFHRKGRIKILAMIQLSIILFSFLRSESFQKVVSTFTLPNYVDNISTPE